MWTSSLPIGEASCLSAALLWAVAVTLFRKSIATYGSRTVNLAKCLLATVLLGATTAAAGQVNALAAAPGRSLVYLVASGIVGLVVGDTALFSAVRRIGVHRTFLLQTLAPVFTALIAFLWKGERPTLSQAAGAAGVLIGVALVVAPRRLRGPGAHPLCEASGRDLSLGTVFGVLSAMAQGGGIVLAKVGMDHVAFLPATALRMTTAALGLAMLGALGRQLRGLGRLLRSPGDLLRVVPATLLGTYVAMILMMVGVALAPASVAAVLLTMSPVFSLFLEAFTERRAPTPRAVLGTALSLVGVGVLIV